ncbi:hypothetical protein [Leucobacter sp. M11]|uniref:hypothetical protein n=1 Tax=Leucobacter sp. M11 TaxID=2993565 RepID=UPI002D7E5B07|nr:hypothetical protein [Leucobacter sp. M11]MEB4615845.1 hypothetical protein [Leucobacter sp. M11]
MTAFLLSVHVIAAILTVGPVAVAASMFPAAQRADPGGAVARILHRICRVYAVIGIIVPVFGVATGASLGVLGDAWLIVSMVLTALAAAVLIWGILPAQAAALGGADRPRLAMSAGVFNLLWAIVVVLMIVRPGSTTGAGL